jgi:predicted MPP superfamily phosphohydrolase
MMEQKKIKRSWISRPFVPFMIYSISFLYLGTMIFILTITWEATMHAISQNKISLYIAYGVVAYLAILPWRKMIQQIRLRPTNVIKKSTIKKLMVFCIISPTIITTISCFPPYFSSKPPQLLITGQLGKNGIPNIMLVWYSDQAYSDKVDWGISGKNLSSVSETNEVKKHTILFSDLTQNTTYEYYIHSLKINRTFITSSIDHINFSIGSDAHFNGILRNREYLTDLFQFELDRGINYLFLLGDLVDSGGGDLNWNYYAEIMAPFSQKIPMATCIGNHDALFGGYHSYSKYFLPIEETDLPKTSFEKTSRYRRIDLTSWLHILILDVEWDDNSFKEDQESWLKSQLQILPTDDWVIIMSHKTVRHEGRITSILNEYKNVDMCFNGHFHVFEQWDNEYGNSSYVGTLGPMTDITGLERGSYFLTSENGITELNINRTTAILEYYNLEENLLYSAKMSQHQI